MLVEDRLRCLSRHRLLRCLLGQPIPGTAACAVELQVARFGQRPQVILDGVATCASDLSSIGNRHATVLAHNLEDLC